MGVPGRGAVHVEGAVGCQGRAPFPRCYCPSVLTCTRKHSSSDSMWKGPGADSEEKREPANEINTCVAVWYKNGEQQSIAWHKISVTAC
jgi:hypothetical protein